MLFSSYKGMCSLFGIVLTALVVPLHAQYDFSEDISLNTTAPYGILAEPGEFPWVVSLKVAKPSEFRACTGTIINPEFVITSGSCIESALDVLVEIGCSYCNETVTSVYGSWKVHPKYKRMGGIILNDLGLVRLKQKVPITEFTNIELSPFHGQDCMVVGYSNLVEDNIVIRKLFKHRLLSILPCHALAPDLEDHKLNLCATTNNTEQIHLEDYGGPVICDAVQIGVASTRIKTKTEDGKYRDVLLWMPISEFREWIQISSSSLSSSPSSPIVPSLWSNLNVFVLLL